MVYRVVQWGTGIVGIHSAPAVIDHPEMELVGCYAYGADKVGKDVGVLCGGAPVGVIATNDINKILALRPDCVLYMPSRWDVDACERMLQAGINIVTTVSFVTGGGYGPNGLERLQAAAVAGKASLFETGIYPGFANALALVATAPCRRVDCVSVFESVDCTNYPSAETWTSMGFGLPADTPGLEDRVKNLMLMFRDTVRGMAPALKVQLDDIAFSAEFGTATEDLALGYMDIKKGMACGVQMRWSGKHKGRTVIELKQMWRLGYAMQPDWKPFGGYMIEVKGLPNVRCDYEITGVGEGQGGLVTAMPAVHAIPAVCAAPPGIVTADQLLLPMGAYTIPA